MDVFFLLYLSIPSYLRCMAHTRPSVRDHESNAVHQLNKLLVAAADDLMEMETIIASDTWSEWLPRACLIASAFVKL